MRLTRIAGIDTMNQYVPPAGVAFDAANSVQGTVVANLTTSAWTISGSDRLLVAGMGWSGGGPPTYSAIKWDGSGGTALTQVGSTLSSAGIRLAIARLIAPATGSKTLYGELSGAADEYCLGGVSATNANQSVPLGSAVTATGTGASSPFTAATGSITSDSADLPIDFSYASREASSGTNTVTVGFNQTQRWKQESIGSFTAGTQSTGAGASSLVMSETFTTSGTSITWGIIGVPIKPV